MFRALRASSRLGAALRAHRSGRIAEAVDRYFSALELCRSHPDPRSPHVVGTYIVVLSNLSEILEAQGRCDEARALAEEGLGLTRAMETVNQTMRDISARLEAVASRCADS